MRKIAPALSALAVAILLVGVVGCSQSDVPEPTVKLPDKTRTVSVYYATGRSIVEERHVVKDDKDIIRTALNEVLAAKPRDNVDIAIVQPECKVLDVTVDPKGLATVNFSKEVLEFDAVGKEKVLVYGAIMETLKQFNQVKSFKFQVEGKEKGTIDGKDVQSFWGDVSLIGQPWKIARK